MTSPATIGPYRVVRSLGQGGMGEVSLAYDERLRRHVALKSVLARHDGGDGRAALVNEARAAAALSHPGIASIFDIIEQEDRAYIVMEFVEGETLAARLRNGPLPVAVATHVATQLCEALDSAHAQRVIHRDLKPGNIMIGGDGRAKILDFGLAKHVTAAAPSAPTTKMSSASFGSGMGTVGYMAPEQLLGQPVDRRCDIFSLGAVLFEMFTGRRAFVERDAIAYGVRATTTDAPSATSVNATVPPAISGVIAKALARDPSDRFESAAALSTALGAASTAARENALPPTEPMTRPTRRMTISAIGLASAVVGALAMLANSRTMPAAATPSILAVMPATAVSVDETLQSIAAGVTATVSSNLGSITGMNVVPGVAATAAGATTTADEVMQRVGAGWALELSIRPRANEVITLATIRAAGQEAAVWQGTFHGDALTSTRNLLVGLSKAVVSAGIAPRVSSESLARLTALPTPNNQAFIDYSHGRRLLSGVVTAGSLDAAASRFESAIARDGQFALAYGGLADSLRRRFLQQRDPQYIERAVEAANHAAALDANHAAVQLNIAQVLSATGRTADALAAVDRAITLQPASDDAYRLRGQLLVQAGQSEQGLEGLKRAIALRPAYYGNHEMLAFSFYRIGRLKDAADSYRRVTELAPEYGTGYQMLGTMLHLQGYPEEAVGHYEHAVRLGPSATAYSNLAYSYYESRRYQDALAAYQESIKRDAKRPAVHRNIGDVFAKLGRMAEARMAYEQALSAGDVLLKINSSDANTIALLALVEAKLGRVQAAERHAAEALALAPKNLEVAVRNAEVYAILRQPGRSLRALKSALGLGYPPTTAAANEELRSLQRTKEFTELLTDQTK